MRETVRCRCNERKEVKVKIEIRRQRLEEMVALLGSGAGRLQYVRFRGPGDSRVVTGVCMRIAAYGVFSGGT